MNEQQMQALAAIASFDQLKAMVVVLASAVVAADVALNSDSRRAQMMARLAVEEAMALLVPRP